MLVPGFLGFGAFGASGTPRIEYFARVKAELARALAADLGASITFVTHEPPAPTGHLDGRAAALFRQLVDLAPAIDRFHLIGHSTGGVDVRHVANRAYPIDGVSVAEREAVVRRIDSVITLSAPLHGTPIARNLKNAGRVLLPPLYLLSILTSRDELRWGGRIGMALLGVRKLLLGTKSGRDRIVPRFLLGVDDATAEQIRRFLGEVVADTGALHDLSPGSMRASDASLSATDHPALTSFVSVGPAASIEPTLDAPVRRALYVAAHGWTTPDATDALPPFPGGPWLGGEPPDLVDRNGANDGVVPACAQTADGNAAGIVYGDHLDVVGHFDAKGGDATVFNSGAHFDDERFGLLWSAIARVIRERALATSPDASLRAS